MAEIANTRWYRLGRVSLTPNSTKVTGVGTKWLTAGINPGATFRLDSSPYAYEVAEVVSDTELTLGSVYAGEAVSGVTYSVDRNFQATPHAKMAADFTGLMRFYEQLRDETFQKIQGESAYELAVKAGYTGSVSEWLSSLKGETGETAYQIAVRYGFKGTEEQWLESLKASHDWAGLNERTEILAGNSAGLHNSIFRGAELGGTVTPEMMAAIRDGSYKNWWLGDVLRIGQNVYVVAHFGYYNQLHTNNTTADGIDNPLINKPHVVLVLCPGYLYDANGTQINVRWSSSSDEVPEGGYLASELAAAYEEEGIILKQIEADLGAENLHQFRITSCNSFENGECKAYTTKLVKACPPTERQLFGERIYSIEDRDHYNERVFAVSNVAPSACPGTLGIKALREIAGSTAVCSNNYGGSGNISPNDTNGAEIQFMCVLA